MNKTDIQNLNEAYHDIRDLTAKHYKPLPEPSRKVDMEKVKQQTTRWISNHDLQKFIQTAGEELSLGWGDNNLRIDTFLAELRKKLQQKADDLYSSATSRVKG
jgi:hypothetical protein